MGGQKTWDSSHKLLPLSLFCEMAGAKRNKSFDTDDFYKQGSSKRVRFEERQENDDYDNPTEFEIDHSESLETAKQRRGAVNTTELSDDEEVGGGAYSSSSGEESDDEDQKGKGKAATKSEDFDMFADLDENEAPEGPKPKNKKRRKLELNEIEGQEFDSRNRESDEEGEDGQGKKGPRLTAFNMREEMEEGSFDAEGNYIRNKADPEAFHDRWMEGVSRLDMARAKEAQDRRDRAEALKEAERQADLPQTKNDVYRELVTYVKPGDSVQETLMKLSSENKKIPAWKQKLLDKKNKNKKQAPAKQKAEVTSGLDEDERKRRVERITALADQMMALGHFGIYDDTFELMVRHLRKEGVVPEDWLPDSVDQQQS